MDVLCTFKIKIESKFGTWVYQRPVTIFKKDQDPKPQSGTCSILQSTKLGQENKNLENRFIIDQ